MVVFPEEFIQLDHPGYYVNRLTCEVFSVKSGTLKRLKYTRGGFFNGNIVQAGYQISVSGRRKVVSVDDINRIIKNYNNSVQVVHHLI